MKTDTTQRTWLERAKDAAKAFAQGSSSWAYDYIIFAVFCRVLTWYDFNSTTIFVNNNFALTTGSYNESAALQKTFGSSCGIDSLISSVTMNLR